MLALRMSLRSAAIHTHIRPLAMVRGFERSHLRLSATAQAEPENLLESRPMEQQSKSSLLVKSAKALALPGFPLALFSLVCQLYTYRESHEESPMVTASLTQELNGDHLQLNRDRHGKLTIEVTNLGNRPR